MNKANPSSLAGMIERMEREAFERDMGAAFGRRGLRRNQFGGYEDSVTLIAWSSWKARAALASKCQGVAHQGCNYLAPCGSVCDKCGAKT